MQPKTKQTLTTLTIALLILPILMTAIPIQQASAAEIQPSALKLESSGTGRAVWTTDYAKTGSYSVELYAPTDGDYGKIVMPLEMAFDDLTGFSCYITADGAYDLPLLDIELDTEALTEDITFTNGGDTQITVPKDAQRVIISSQPEDAGIAAGEEGKKTDTDINTWQQYGVGVATDGNIDASGQWWRVFWVDAQGTWHNSGGEPGDLVTWDTITTAFSGTTIKHFCVELRYPPAESIVYIDDIVINEDTYVLELEQTLMFTVVPDVVKAGTTDVLEAADKFTVQLADQYGNPIKQENVEISLETDSKHGILYKSDKTTPITSDNPLKTGAEGSADFYYLDAYGASRDVNITASATGWESATAILPVVIVDGSEAFVYVGDTLVVNATAGKATQGGEVKIYWDAVKDWDGEKGLLDSTYADKDGAFEVEVTVPDAVYGSHAIYAYDVMGKGVVLTATINVESKIVLDPDFGLPGDTIVVNGTGFSGESGVTVNIIKVTNETVGTGNGDETEFNLGRDAEDTPTVYLDGEKTTAFKWSSTDSDKITFNEAPGDGVEITATYKFKTAIKVSPAGLKSSEYGSFTMNFKIPELRNGIYTVEAVDENDVSASADLTITALYIKLEPEKGLPGTMVTVTGRGFTPNSAVDIYFGMPAEEGKHYPNGFFQSVKTGVATNPAGDFETTFAVPSAMQQTYEVAAEDEEGVIAYASFEVVAEPEITLSKETGLPGAEITVAGNHFTGDSAVTIYLDSEVLAEDIDTNSTGGFSETVTIPEDAEKGMYEIKVVDAEGLSATEDFEVVEKVTIIAPMSKTYSPRDLVCFYIYTTLQFDSGTEIIIDLVDPSGYDVVELPNATINVDEADWKTNGAWELSYIPIFELPSDAKTGDWNYTVTYTMDGEEIEYTEQFTVKSVAVPGFEDLAARVSALEESMTSLSETVEALSDKVDTLSTAVSALNIQAVSETVNSVKSDVADLKDDLESVKSDISEVSDTVSDVQSAVQDAVDAAGEAQAAAENASTAVSNIQIAVYGAIILSLIAALASIIAVITLQRKIAG